MLLTNIFSNVILLAKSEEGFRFQRNVGHAAAKPRGKIILQEVRSMFIYDRLNYLAEDNGELGVNALSYVVLGCGR